MFSTVGAYVRALLSTRLRFKARWINEGKTLDFHCGMGLIQHSRDTECVPINVLVVEDDDLTRVSITAALSSAGFNVAGSVSTSADAVRHGKSFQAQAALIDLHLGKGPSGIDVAHELRKLDPRIGIVFLTTFEDPRLLSGARELPRGSQYLVKKEVANLESISRSIFRSLEGKSRLVRTDTAGALSHLSDIQLSTLRMLAEGLSNAEIARQRQVSEKSVEAVINRIATSLSIPRSAKLNTRVNLARAYLEAMGHGIARK